MNRLVFSEDEKSRGRMMENETILLMETRSQRAMSSKMLATSKHIQVICIFQKLKISKGRKRPDLKECR